MPRARESESIEGSERKENRKWCVCGTSLFTSLAIELARLLGRSLRLFKHMVCAGAEAFCPLLSMRDLDEATNQKLVTGAVLGGFEEATLQAPARVDEQGSRGGRWRSLVQAPLGYRQLLSKEIAVK